MDAPPNGPEEGLIPRSPALLVAGVELLGAGDGTVELDVAGTSMLPTLSPGDRVRIRLDRRTPKVGEIVVFSQGDSIVVHRYLGPAAARDVVEAIEPALETLSHGRCTARSCAPSAIEAHQRWREARRGDAEASSEGTVFWTDDGVNPALARA